MATSIVDTGGMWGSSGGLDAIAFGERVEVGDDLECLCHKHRMCFRKLVQYYFLKIFAQHYFQDLV